MVSALSFWGVVSCILIIPIFVLIYRMMEANRYRIEFYDDKIIVCSGLLDTHKRVSAFVGVAAVSYTQTLFGRMFDYGDVHVDCAGKWDINTSYIKDPEGLEAYLQTKIVSAANTTIIAGI